MTNTLALANTMVKTDVDQPVSREQPKPVDTLAKRLKSIVEASGLSEGAFSEAAGLARSHVGTIIHDPTANPTRKTLAKLADQGKVNLEWLATGTGPRTRAEPTVEYEERYHAMPAVRAMARADGYPDGFVATFEEKLDFDYQPTADHLWSMLKVAWESHQRSEARAGKALPPKTPDRGADPLADHQEGRPFRGKRPA